MSKKVVKGICLPPFQVCFSGRRTRIGMSFQDVESHASNIGQVGGGMVLSGSGVVLMENNVERPMQIVLHAPLGPDGLHHLGWRHFARQGDIVNTVRSLALEGLAL